MSNNKQSSVEWLVKELNQKIDFIPMNKWDEIKEVIEQAKAMHKEEIIEFAINFTYGTKRVGESIKKDFIKLYNETFGGNNEQAMIDYNKMEEESEMDNYNEMKNEQQ